jgi:hypothetical protein
MGGPGGIILTDPGPASTAQLSPCLALILEILRRMRPTMMDPASVTQIRSSFAPGHGLAPSRRADSERPPVLPSRRPVDPGGQAWAGGRPLRVSLGLMIRPGRAAGEPRAVRPGGAAGRWGPGKRPAGGLGTGPPAMRLWAPGQRAVGAARAGGHGGQARGEDRSRDRGLVYRWAGLPPITGMAAGTW